MDTLKYGLPGITKTVGQFLWEAAVVCLEGNGHRPGARLNVFGEHETAFELEWSALEDENALRFWSDNNESVEYGATAIAVLVIMELTSFSNFQKLPQNESADYLILSKKNIREKAYLEISGIWVESPQNSINMRVNKKLKRLLKNNQRGIENFVVVTEFGTPKSKISRR